MQISYAKTLRALAVRTSVGKTMRAAKKSPSLLKRLGLVFLIATSVSLLFFRKYLLLGFVHAVLLICSSIFHLKTDYHIGFDSSGKMKIEGLHLENPAFFIQTKIVFLDFEKKQSAFQITPSLLFEGLHVGIKEKKEEKVRPSKISLPLLRFFFNKTDLIAEDALLSLETKGETLPFIFQLDIRGRSEEKLTFSLNKKSEETSASLIDLCLFLEDNHWVVALESHRAPLEQLSRLLSFFPIPSFSNVKGDLDLKAKASLSPLWKVESIELQAEGFDIAYVEKEIGLETPHLQGALTWEKTEEKGSLLFNPALKGSFRVKSGKIAQKEVSLPFSLETSLEGQKLESKLQLEEALIETKGHIESPFVFAIDSSLSFQGREELFVSYVKESKEKSFLHLISASLDLKHLVKAWAFFDLPIRPLQGFFKGNVLASFQAGKLIALEGEKGELEQYGFSYKDQKLFGDRLSFDARFQRGKSRLELKECSLLGDALSFYQGKEALLEGVQFHGSIMEGRLKEFTLAGAAGSKPLYINAAYQDEEETKIRFHVPSLLIEKGLFAKEGLDIEAIGEGVVVLKEGDYLVGAAFKAGESSFLLNATHPKAKGWDISDTIGTLYSSDFSYSLCNKLLKRIEPSCEITGKGDLQISYALHKLHIETHPLSYEISHPYLGIKEEVFSKKKSWGFTYDLKTKELNGQLSVDQAQLISADKKSVIDGFHADFFMEKDRIFSKNCKVHSKELKTAFFFESSFEKEPLILFKVQELEIDLNTLQSFIKPTSICLPMLSGKLTQKEKGGFFVFRKEKEMWERDYQFLLDLKVDETSLSPGLFLKKASATLSFSKEKAFIGLTSGVGEIASVQKTEGRLIAKEIRFNTLNQEIAFDLAFVKEKMELLQASGLAYFHEKKGIAFDPKIELYFLNQKVEIEGAELDTGGAPKLLKVKSTHRFLDFLPFLGALPEEMHPHFFTFAKEQFSAPLQWSLVYLEADRLWNFQAKTAGSFMKGEPQHPVSFQVLYYNKRFQVEIRSEKGESLNAELLCRNARFEIPFFELISPHLSVFAKADFDTKTHVLSGEVNKATLSGSLFKKYVAPALNGSATYSGSFQKKDKRIDGTGLFELHIHTPESVTVSTKDKTLFSFVEKQGLSVPLIKAEYFLKDGKKGNLELIDSLFSAEEIKIREGYYAFSKADLHFLHRLELIPAFIETLSASDPLKGVFSLTKTPHSFQIKGRLQPFIADFYSYKTELKGVRYEVNNKGVYVASSTQIQEMPVKMELRVDLKEKKPGVLYIRSDVDNDLLKGYFQGFQGDIPAFTKIEGCLSGLTLHLKKDKGGYLAGDVGIDGKKLVRLFPKTQGAWLKELGSGIKLTGQLDLFRKKKGFYGKLLGDHFEAFSHQIKAMEASVKWDDKKLLISDLKIQDKAGELWAKKIDIATAQEWQLSCPLLQISHFQPSLMKTLLSKEKEIKPLIIKKLSVHDLEGSLLQLQSLRGYGELCFTNFVEKESDFFDIPRNFFKNLGLDTSLLTPTGGEIRFTIQDKKIFLSELAHVISEEGRSEFFLNNPQGFIDFDGNINVDVGIRQNVTFKIIEPFTLSIRGTLKKPKYLLK